MGGHEPKIGSVPRCGALGLGAACGIAWVLTGCTSTVPQRSAAGGWGSGDVAQGAAWEAVMAPPEVQQRLAYEDPRIYPEFGRSDWRLSRADDGPPLASAQWPTPARADLNQLRSVTVRDSAGRITYFDRERRWSRGRWAGGGCGDADPGRGR